MIMHVLDVLTYPCRCDFIPWYLFCFWFAFGSFFDRICLACIFLHCTASFICIFRRWLCRSLSSHSDCSLIRCCLCMGCLGHCSLQEERLGHRLFLSHCSTCWPPWLIEAQHFERKVGINPKPYQSSKTLQNHVLVVNTSK